MNAERASALPAYRSTRIYHLDYRGFPGSRAAEMIVDVDYAPPQKKVFSVRSQSGSKLIIDRVFKRLIAAEQEAFEPENQRRTALNEENYAFSLLRCDGTPEGLMYVFAVEPKINSKFLYRGKIWVDATDFAVSRISAQPAHNPSFWIRETEIEQQYRKVAQSWLPQRNHSVTAVRLGGHADLTIEYTDYQMTGAGPTVSANSTISSRK